MKAPLRIQGVYKRMQKQSEAKRQEKQEKNTHKYPTTAENPKHPNKNPKPSTTLHHSNPLAFSPSRTKTPSIIIDFALKVIKFSLFPLTLEVETGTSM
jgi:sRNA-binding protein